MTEAARVIVGVMDSVLRRRLIALASSVTAIETAEALTGYDALALALESIPDLMVLSAQLSGMDGFAVCHNVRATEGYADVPIMLLGRSETSHHKYQAFYVGATDYMSVPLDYEEFSLRVRVHLRAQIRRFSGPTILDGFGLRLDANTLTLTVSDAAPVSLTRSEFAILRVLLESAGNPVSTDALLNKGLRKPAKTGNPQIVHTHIKNLRKKLEPGPNSPRRLFRSSAGYFLQEASRTFNPEHKDFDTPRNRPFLQE